MERVDAYLHCGLRKYRPIRDVDRVMEAAGVVRAVIVQHLDEFDNGYIAGIVQERPARFAGVCLVDHTRADAADSLRQLVIRGPFKGVRFTEDSLREAPELWRVAADSGATIVFYTPGSIARSAGPLRKFLDDHERCRLVVTHLGNPDLTEDPRFNAHRRVLMTLAQYPNVYLQISGMEMFCPYPHSQLYPLIRDAAQGFAGSRLIWGSNYPVVGESGEYRRELGLLLDGRLPLPGEALLPAIAGGNAVKLWFER